MTFTAAEQAAMSENPNDFRRAFLNQWVLRNDPKGETVVDMGAWMDLVDIEEARPNPVAFSLEVSNDRKWSSIGLAGRRTDGLTHLQIVQAGRGSYRYFDRTRVTRREAPASSRGQ